MFIYSLFPRKAILLSGSMFCRCWSFYHSTHDISLKSQHLEQYDERTAGIAGYLLSRSLSWTIPERTALLPVFVIKYVYYSSWNKYINNSSIFLHQCINDLSLVGRVPMERKTKMPNVLKKRRIIALSSKIDGEYACKRLNTSVIPLVFKG